MLHNVTEVTPENLLNEVAAKAPFGYRFVTMTCTDLGDAFDIIYHFDRDYELHNLRLRLPKGQELPSISVIYFAAVVVENEIKDLFGLQVKGLILDYNGRMLLSEEVKAPLLKAKAAVEDASDAKPAAREGVETYE